MKLLRDSIIGFILGLSVTFAVYYFIEHNIKKEFFKYMTLNNKIIMLNDTYSLCDGLIQTNPSEKNIETCKLVSKKLEITTLRIKEECPFINFYLKYIGDFFEKE